MNWLRGRIYVLEFIEVVILASVLSVIISRQATIGVVVVGLVLCVYAFTRYIFERLRHSTEEWWLVWIVIAPALLLALLVAVLLDLNRKFVLARFYTGDQPIPYYILGAKK